MYRGLFLLFTFLSGSGIIQASPSQLDKADKKVLIVDCDQGPCINQALLLKTFRLEIVVHGVCQETVVINRDNVTIRGGTPDAAIIGATDDPEPRPAITIDGGRNVALQDLTICDDDHHGVKLTNSAQATLHNVTVTEANSGVLVENRSDLYLSDSRLTGNRRDGLSQWNLGRSYLSGNIQTSSNNRMGIILGSGSILESAIDCNLQSNGNGTSGLWMQSKSIANFFNADGLLQAEDNGYSGVVLMGSSNLVVANLEVKRNQLGLAISDAANFESNGGSVQISENEEIGMIIGANSSASLHSQTDVSDNGQTGVEMESSATGFFQYVKASNHEWCGFLIKDSSAEFGSCEALNNGIADVRLDFGARGIFRSEGNTFGTVQCLEGVLTSGDVNCTSKKAGEIPAMGPEARDRRSHSSLTWLKSLTR